MARKFDSEIRIHSNGKWFFRGQEITQENVLNFFKKNLKEDEQGVFIENHYGGLTEHGYLESYTFLLKIKSIIEKETLYFISEVDEVLNLSDITIYHDSNESIFIRKNSEQLIRYNLSLDAISTLSKYLQQNNNHYSIVYNSIHKEIILDDKENFISLPDLKNQ
jgi:hypothetical protein